MERADDIGTKTSGEIEVTPEMIEAGVRVLLDSAAFDGDDAAAEVLVERIYEAANLLVRNERTSSRSPFTVSRCA